MSKGILDSKFHNYKTTLKLQYITVIVSLMSILSCLLKAIQNIEMLKVAKGFSHLVIDLLYYCFICSLGIMRSENLVQ